METSTVEIEVVNDTTLEGNARVHKKCFFCLKDVVVNKKFDTLGKKVTGSPAYFCTFCVRNQFYTKKRKNILIMSFRGIIGYYYYSFYMMPTPGETSIYLAELFDHINLHVQAGLQNPLYSYDPESFCWFVDFSRIGRARKQVDIGDILSTTVEILATFNFPVNVKKLDQGKLYEKYKSAIVDFYEKRLRPKDRKILSPTVFDCGVEKFIGSNVNTRIDVKELGNFMPKQIVY